MRIAELSKRSGVAVPTIKFYLREGMLPPGERTSPNQAQYGEDHVRRLRLVRAMIDIGGLSVASVREVLAKVDSPVDNIDELMGAVSKALVDPPADVDPDALAEVGELIDALGWDCNVKHPSAASLAAVFTAARAIGHERIIAGMRRYAEACELIAAVDLDYVEGEAEVDRVLESVVVGTILGDSAVGALRRLAQAAESGKRYPG
ncbi:MerR family transcriptional regulator [Actinokineospora sp. HUAS TT18]|uniref:MerR family transcriptional regulator n=1 Tax=Actinokineospora sp. HUAS TT18 TaxID=3447451 RepID=UPI003F527ECD